MELNFKIIGSNIKELRSASSISQAELAEKIDSSPSYVSRIETGRKRASLEVLIKISNVLGCTLDELLRGLQLHDQYSYATGINSMLSGCSNLEMRMIFEMSEVIKRNMQEFRCTQEGDYK